MALLRQPGPVGGPGRQGRPAGLGRVAAHHEPADGDPGRVGGGTRPGRPAGGGQRLHLRGQLLPRPVVEGWLARGWLTSAKKPVANRDLWEPLVAEIRSRATSPSAGSRALRRPDERPGGPAGGRGGASRGVEPNGRLGTSPSAGPGSPFAAWSRGDSAVPGQVDQVRPHSGFLGLRTPSHHWPVIATMPTSIWEYIGTDLASSPSA